MPARTLQTWIARRLSIRQRLERVCTSYLLFLMVVMHNTFANYEKLKEGGET